MPFSSANTKILLEKSGSPSLVRDGFKSTILYPIFSNFLATFVLKTSLVFIFIPPQSVAFLAIYLPKSCVFSNFKIGKSINVNIIFFIWLYLISYSTKLPSINSFQPLLLKYSYTSNDGFIPFI